VQSETAQTLIIIHLSIITSSSELNWEQVFIMNSVSIQMLMWTFCTDLHKNIVYRCPYEQYVQMPMWTLCSFQVDRCSCRHSVQVQEQVTLFTDTNVYIVYRCPHGHFVQMLRLTTQLSANIRKDNHKNFCPPFWWRKGSNFKKQQDHFHYYEHYNRNYLECPQFFCSAKNERFL